jgi:adenosylcobinamide-GDP ribazoletransferase
MKIFLNAIGFLTIFKINSKFFLKKEQFWKISYYFPFIGIVIGLIMIVFYYAISFILPVFICIILTLGLEVLITGAMHLDGFSDTIDGIFCGEKDKNKIFKVMKKSDIGVFGVNRK